MGQPKKENARAPVLPLALVRDKAEERYVQGDLAGMTELLRQALSNSSVAYAIAQRRRGLHPVLGDRINSLQVEALDKIVESAGEAEAAAEHALREVIAASPLLYRCYKPKLEEKRR